MGMHGLVAWLFLFSSVQLQEEVVLPMEPCPPGRAVLPARSLPRPLPQPSDEAVAYATPRPAPPSPEKVLAFPREKRAQEPKVTEQRGTQPNAIPLATQGGVSTFFDAYYLATEAETPPADERCSVSFWNLSRKELIVVVAGERHTLRSGGSVLLQVNRQFRWNVEGREPEAAKVPQSHAGMEIVLRH